MCLVPIGTLPVSLDMQCMIDGLQVSGILKEHRFFNNEEAEDNDMLSSDPGERGFCSCVSELGERG